MSESDLDILLVDHSPEDVQRVRESLAKIKPGLRMRQVAAGPEVKALVDPECAGEKPVRPRLILLDWRLPDDQAPALLSALKSKDRLKRIPVIVWTRSPQPEEVREAYHRFANSFLAKPGETPLMEQLLEGTVNFWINTAQLPDS